MRKSCLINLLKIKWLSVFFILIISKNKQLFAQDVKFSQYFAAPLTVNPALCGIYSGESRLEANYRNQWQNIAFPFVTATFSAETQLQSENFQDDILAIGINAMTDRSNNGGLSNNSIAGNISFHKVLDAENYSRIGAGLQVSYNSTLVDYSKMTFESQFTPYGYNGSLPTNEGTNGVSISNFDYAAGILYSYFSGDLNIYGGASFYHLGMHTENYGNVSIRIPMRTTIHAGFSFTVGEINTLYGSFVHMSTSLSSQTTIGMVYGLNMNGGSREGEGDEITSNELLIGSWYRFNDAIVPYIGLKIGNIQGGISYDITTSSVTIANGGMGAFELSANVLLNADPNRAKLRKLKCKFMMY